MNTNGSQLVNKQQVRNMLRSKVVRKYWNLYTNTTAAATLSFTDLSAVPSGTGPNTRTGTQLHMDEIKIRMVGQIADTTNFLRFIVFRWIPSDSSDGPSASELLSSAYSAGNNEFFCETNPIKPSRFHILHDETIAMDVAHVVWHRNITLKLNSSVSFDTGSTTGREHIYIAYVSDSGVVPNPTFSFTSMLSFDE